MGDRVVRATVVDVDWAPKNGEAVEARLAAATGWSGEETPRNTGEGLEARRFLR